ncbi:putative bifunctional diguanylate cyclase/phosphodiesterase [Prosthecomicrobium sp. N25]|uniref:putative bifunctional diguanylate cyclase/phosphodiesterase n=1 Tax=Prosthecomicrobium sp. N25 TaxID=3129254 RepID=UPI003076C39C
MLRRRLILAVLVGTGLVIATLLGGTLLVLSRAEDAAWRGARESLDRSARTAEAIVNRHLLQVDGALASLPGLMPARDWDDPAAASRLLKGLNFQTFAFRDLLILDGAGNVQAAGRHRPTGRTSPIGAEAAAAATDTGIGTLIGPIREAQTGDWAVYLVRALVMPGRETVIAAAEIPIGFITTPLASLGDTPGLRIRIERPDGHLYASLPHAELALGRKGPPLGRPGRVERGEAVDGEGRRLEVLATRRSTLYAGVDVALDLDTGVALGSWSRERERITLAATLAALVILAFAGALVVALRRQDRLDRERISAQDRLAEAVEAMSDGFVMWDEEDRLVTCNRHYLDLYALSAPYMVPGATFSEIMRQGALAGQYPQAGDDLEGFVERTVAWHRAGKGTIERLLPDGRWLLVTERRTANGGYVGIRTEITALKKALSEVALANEKVRATMAEMQHQNLLFDTALRNMPHGLLMVDAENRVIVSNRRFADLFGLDADRDLHGCRLADVFATDEEGALQDRLAARQRSIASRAAAASFVVVDRQGRAVSVTQRPMPDGGFVAIYEDVTEKQQTEAQVRYLAHHDPLTGLPNRVLFRKELEERLRGSSRENGLGVLYLDLDKFKDVNDTMGHPTGDALLTAVAERLRRSLRDSDLVARLGGDEFAVALGGPRMAQKARDVSRRVIAELSRPYRLGDRTVNIGVSIGAAVAGRATPDVDSLMKNADLALYEAKASGRGTVAMFRPAFAAKLHERLELESDLRGALAQAQMELDYQPLFHLESQRVVGFEALLRWNHPGRGRIAPAAFVPLAEDTGLIDEIGLFALDRACRDIAPLPDVKVAVNLSPMQLKSPTLTRSVLDALAGSGLAPTRLELEVTETVLLEEDERILATLHGLREAGIRIVLDDFGTGYSSLAYLRRFPFDKIKIDKVFVRDATSRPDCAAIVTSIIDLAQRLGIGTTAEGIETQEQLDLVRRLGCTEGQGYLLGEPASALNAVKTLRDEAAVKRPRLLVAQAG